MAYRLRYYKEIAQPDDTVVRLEILMKGYEGEAIEIGDVVQGLSLQIQGQQGDIDTPIIKTSLSMTFIDAMDIEDGRKNGNWEEFYTADSTMWRVNLIDGTNGKAFWGGYITPDSYSEDLVYRGSVNIIARDNIGHLQDFLIEIDKIGFADGTIDLISLIDDGWSKIESPMSLEWLGDGESVKWPLCDGVPLYNARFNLSYFDGLNYFEAIEKALYSIGCVMRYIGRNKVQVCPLRDMPKHGYYDYIFFGALNPTFEAVARRELVPAIKMIDEVEDYELEKTLAMPQVKTDDFTGQQLTYRCKIEGKTFGTLEHDAPVWPIAQQIYSEGWNNETSKTLFFDLSRYQTGYFTDRLRQEEAMRKYMYIAANNVDDRMVRFDKNIALSDFSIRIKFGQPISLNSINKLEVQSVFNLKSISYSIVITQGIVEYYYKGNGDWQTSLKILTKNYQTSEAATEFTEQVYINNQMIENINGNEKASLIIHKIEYAQMGYGSLQDKGLYACIQEMAFGLPETMSLMEKNTIKTVYNESNNIVLKRNPALAPAFDNVLLPGFIKNGIFVADDNAKKPAAKWYFAGKESTQLGVLIHKQLLCYLSKPNNLLTGTIVNVGTISLTCNWIWKNKEHILISGNLDLLTGNMENAVLREFERYEDVWKSDN